MKIWLNCIRLKSNFDTQRKALKARFWTSKKEHSFLGVKPCTLPNPVASLLVKFNIQNTCNLKRFSPSFMDVPCILNLLQSILRVAEESPMSVCECRPQRELEGAVLNNIRNLMLAFCNYSHAAHLGAISKYMYSEAPNLI